MEQPKTFETAITRLESIVEIMEKGEIPLEEALELYREGQVLLKSCQDKLNEAEQKLKILVKDSTGEITTKDSPESGN
jgi:exodeoxyribonuclease VII small subunit